MDLILFRSQTLYRIGKCCFDGLKTDGYKRDKYGCRTREGNHPPLYVLAIGKIAQPKTHYPPG